MSLREYRIQKKMERLRKVAIVLNAIAIAVSLGIAVYSLFAKRHLEKLATEYVTEKTVEYVAPQVSQLKVHLDSKLAQLPLVKTYTERAKVEVAKFEAEPRVYVAKYVRVASESVHAKGWKQGGEAKNTWQKIQKGIVTHYQRVLKALILNVRIFSISNFVFSSLALLLLLYGRLTTSVAVVALSLTMFGAVCYGSYMFVDSLSFFRIIVGMPHIWSYPLLLSLFTADNYRRSFDLVDIFFGKKSEPEWK